MFIKQVSIFVENKKGTIADAIGILGRNNINIRALSVADTTDYGILRLIVDDPEKAYSLLKGSYTLKLTDVIGFTIPDRPNGLGEVLSLLHNENIEINYVYTFVGHIKDEALCIIKPTDLEGSLKILKDNNIRIIDNKAYIE